MIGAALPPNTVLQESGGDEEEMQHDDTSSEHDDQQDEVATIEQQGADNRRQPADAMSDEQLEILEQKVAANMFSFDHHAQLIDQYRKRNQFEKMRQACQGAHTYFALTEGMWVDWLNDEIAHSKNTPEERQRVEQLFKAALDDYCMPLVWNLYCDFISSTQKNVFEVRNVFEQAIASTLGFNMKWSHELWDLYRDFEQNLPLDDSLVTQSCRQLFTRQFSHPHLDVEETWRKYEEWEESDQEKQVMRKHYEECKRQLQSRKQFETWVKRESPAGQIPNEKLTNAWIKYLEFEKQQGDPVRLLALYERVIKECSLVDRFWLEYVDLLETQQATPEKILSVCRRACRNITWNGRLWSSYLLQAERCSLTKDLIDCDIYGRAWNMGLRAADDYQLLCLAYCGYLRRLMDANQERTELPSALATALEQAVQYMAQYFPYHDTHCTLERFWAHVEAFRFGDLEKGRHVYQSYIIDRFGSTHLHIWNYAVYFEQLLGADTPALRQIYEKGINQLSQSAQVKHLGLEWQQFERERGDLQTFQSAKLLFDKRFNSLLQEEEEKKRRKKQAITSSEHVDSSIERQPKKKKESTMSSKKETTTSTKKGEEKKKNGEDRKRKREINEDDTKRTKQNEKKKKKVNDEMIIGELQPNTPQIIVQTSSKQDLQQPPQQPISLEQAPGQPTSLEETQQPAQKTTASKYKPTLRGPGNENLTLFAWSLPFSLDEYALRKLFEQVECEVEDVRLIRNFKGISKGYAYVEMKDQESMDRGLTLNETELDGRKIKVNPSKKKVELVSEKKEKKQQEATDAGSAATAGEQAGKVGHEEVKEDKQKPQSVKQVPKTKPYLLKPRVVSTKQAQQPRNPPQPLSNADFKNFFK